MLYNIEFRGGVPNDKNRAADGIRLRQAYSDTCSDNSPCTVLELLVALSIRMDYNLCEVGGPERPGKWFLEMIDNLELEKYPGWELEEDNVFKNQFIIDRFLDRTYSRSGHGGLFPLNQARRDQRRIEIWYQMMAYLDENY